MIGAIEHLIPTLEQMNALKLLDASLFNEKLDAHKIITSNPVILQLLESESLLPNLVSLDISGWKEVVPKESLLAFIKNHTKLEFLGIEIIIIIFLIYGHYF